jgi:CRP-like cAMP-binding protein
LYVIQSGAVRVGAARPEGGRARLLGPGNILGEESFFVRVPHATRAEVAQDARLIQVSDRTLDAVVRHGPRTARLVFEQLLTLTGAARSELAAWTIEQLLRRLAPNLTEAAGGGIAPADLAEHSGLVESDVLLVLEELRQRGCLVRDGDGYRASDPALLLREIDRFSTGVGHA